MPPDEEELRARIEAALYAAGRPLDLTDLARAAGITSKRKALKIVKKILKSMNENMLALEIAELPGQKFAMQLKTRYTKVARRFSLRPLMPKAVLKTLSHIVYLQPVSSSDLAARRGPQAYSHLKKLRELGFIEAERSGRSSIYRTTDTFSEYFGLSTDPERIRRELASLRSGSGYGSQKV
ncbi:MAG: SMC-Scp complex subunit ScpB [Nitrososphaerales archaeon]